MIKIIGSVIFILGGFLLGRSMDMKYKEKEEFWRESSEFVTFCETEIAYNGSDMEKISNKIRQSGKKYSEIMADCIQNKKTLPPETNVISDFISELKSTDLSTQKKVFDNYTKIINKKIQTAQNDRKQKGKAYSKLIPLLCIGMVIVLW